MARLAAVCGRLGTRSGRLVGGTASGQLTALGSQWSVGSDRLAVIGSQWSARSGRLAVVSRQLTVIGSQSSARIRQLALTGSQCDRVVGSHCWPTGERAMAARQTALSSEWVPGSSLGVDVRARWCHARAVGRLGTRAGPPFSAAGSHTRESPTGLPRLRLPGSPEPPCHVRAKQLPRVL